MQLEDLKKEAEHHVFAITFKTVGDAAGHSEVTLVSAKLGSLVAVETLCTQCYLRHTGRGKLRARPEGRA